MSRSSLLKAIKKAYPELETLSKPKLRVVENAIVYASQLAQHDDLLTDAEHDELMEKITPKGGLTPHTMLKAYRMRADLTQSELAEKCDIPQANISAMEKGKRPIGIHMAKKLAHALKCDYKRLL